MAKEIERALASLGGDWSKAARANIRQTLSWVMEVREEMPQPIWGKPREAQDIKLLKLLVQIHLGPDAICAGLLALAVERGDIALEEVEERCSKKIHQLTSKVSALPSFSFTPPNVKKERSRHREQTKAQAESFRRMLLATAQDMRVVMLRLVLLVHQLREMPLIPVEKQMAVALECREIGAPLANRLGISWLKNELEDLTLRYLYPRDFYALAAKLSTTKNEREAYIVEVHDTLETLVEEQGFKAEVAGRSKHINSIYRKLKKRGVSFEQLFDITAFRIVCETKEQCYQLLGLIHARWTPVPGRFKDYIALPKSNQYQSLHTTVIGPQQRRMEVQIRTFEMHRIAENGIAAHWLYKESGSSAAATGEGAGDVQWLRSLLHLQEEKGDDQEFMAHVKDHLFEERVFVFTPKGDVKELMYGATPLDFAYAVHTQVGMRCIGAKVNGKMVPLKYTLKNGDMVDIKTSPSASPNRGHLDIVKTGRAITKIRSFLRGAQREQAVQIGRELLEKELPSSHKRISKLVKSGEMLSVAEQMGWATVDELLMQVGYGKLGVQAVMEALFPPDAPTAPEETQDLFDALPPQAPRSNKKAKGSGVLVDGMDGILVRMARCCNPIPGDPIVGFISRGRGAIVHTTGCHRVQELDPARQIEVSWANDSQTTHTVALRLITENKPGLLTKISRVFSDSSINITSANCQTMHDEAINIFQCQVTDVGQLRRLSQQLSQIKGVNRVERLRR